MADKRFVNGGIVTALVGAVVLMIGVVMMIYPKLVDRRGESELTHPYFGEGSLVSFVGGIVLLAGFVLNAVGKHLESKSVNSTDNHPE